jgi:hypothetical protein
MKTYFLTSLALVFFSLTSLAQDKIYKTNQDVIECEIIEIGETEVKYHLENNKVLFVISTGKIEKIVFENGDEMTFTQPIDDPEFYARMKTTAWKFGLFSPLTGATNFGIEKMLKPGRSLELNVGIIGLGQNNSGLHSAGGFLKAGYKFVARPNFNLKGMTYSHPLHGWYIKPEIAISTYEQEYQTFYWPNGPVSGINSVFSSAALINIGKQSVFADVMVLDFSVGIGYGFDNMTEKKLGGTSENKVEMYHYGYFLGGEVPLAISGSIRVGFLTK